MKKDKIHGLFKGVAVGDQLEMAVETYDAAKIRKRHGRITGYIDPDPDHKWYKGMKAQTTDDWQQTVIVMRSTAALIRSKPLFKKGTCFNPEVIARHHLEAYRKEETFGWGKTTRQAIKNMFDGFPWDKAGVNGSGGNGTIMKMSPLAVDFARSYPDLTALGRMDEKDRDKLVKFTVMTHNSDLAVAATFTHLYALVYLLNVNRAKDFNSREFLALMLDGCDEGYFYAKRYGVAEINDNLFVRLQSLAKRAGSDNDRMSDEEIISEFGGGKAYLYDCLPFIYAFFLRNPYSIKSLYDVISAGGDTDTNGSILASMLGALNGERVFPDRLIDGLWNKNEALALIDRFCGAVYYLEDLCAK
ncbi:MAG: ADP-ribosylglycohydrolase family protein [Candidatus Falkowbacteria bacterium]